MTDYVRIVEKEFRIRLLNALFLLCALLRRIDKRTLGMYAENFRTSPCLGFLLQAAHRVESGDNLLLGYRHCRGKK